MSVRPDVIAAFLKQSRSCRLLGSPFTADVLACTAGLLAGQGPLQAMVGDWPGDPARDVLPLRIAGALHALALSGSMPDLAALYPPRGTGGDPAMLSAAVAAAAAAHRGHFAGYLATAPQTNEVGRSAALLGGFLEVARQTGLPLRLLEIGASAGLNLLWDRYRYRLGAASWGDPASPVAISAAWSGPPPALGVPVRIVSRAGCDRAPVDPGDPAQALRLRAYVWADQCERLELLDRAIALARDSGLRVEQADAGEWVERQLAVLHGGEAAVLYHSIMWQYLSPEAQAQIVAAIRSAGHHSAPDRPLAWLRLEAPAQNARPELALTLWPGGRTRRLAVAHWHGSDVHWTG